MARFNETVMTVASALVALSAVAVTVTVVRERWFTEPRTASATDRVETVRDWKRYAEGSHRRGPPEATVTVVEFADFQCPFCREFAVNLDSVLQRYPGRLAVVFRHFPLQLIHPFARDAATASLCAERQRRFWEFHDEIFRDQREIGLTPWEEFAARSGIPDSAAFAVCLKEKWPNASIEADSLEGAILGVRGTPAFLVNDKLYRGSPSLPKLDSIIRGALKQR